MHFLSGHYTTQLKLGFRITFSYIIEVQDEGRFSSSNVITNLNIRIYEDYRLRTGKFLNLDTSPEAKC